MSDLATAPAQLKLTPGLLRGLLAGVEDLDATWKPAAGRFSVAEVLAHLAHCESYAYLPKYRQFASGAEGELEPYDVDGFTAQGAYAGRPAQESLADFERQREASLALIEGLPNRTLTHRKVGPISLSDLLNECAFHDLGHVRQIAELIRARKYFPSMGLYAKFYKVNP